MVLRLSDMDSWLGAMDQRIYDMKWWLGGMLLRLSDIDSWLDIMMIPDITATNLKTHAMG